MWFKRSKQSSTRQSVNREALLFLLPAIGVLIITTIFPFVYCVWISLHDIRIFYPVPVTFVGAGNYYGSLVMPIYGLWNAVYNTVIFTGASLTIEVFLGLAIALLLNKEIRGVWTLRSVIPLPLLISPISIGLIFRLIFLPGDWALANWMLTSLGLAPLNWLAEPPLAMLTLIFTDVWQWTPFMALIFLAGLQLLPPEPFETALVDGATSLKTFRYITLPLLREMFVIAILLRLMDSLKTFDIIYIVTQGGPGERTQILNFNAFVQAFTYGNISIAASQIILMSLVVIFLSAVLIRSVRAR
ncbi:MAG: sugar ABC transporter permease [Aigarchaeota archaeon]|nr:sugar ABC transporter permease [Candidatus Calditenuaceae archaeon]